MPVTVTVIINKCAECRYIRNDGWNNEINKVDRKCVHPHFTILDSYVIPFPNSTDIPLWCPLKHGKLY